MSRLPAAFLLLLTALPACPEAPSPPPQRVAASPQPSRAQVAWDREVSVYDVLDRDTTAVQLVQVRRRSLPPGIRSDFADRDDFGPGSPPYRVLTVCGDRFCADGLVTRDQVSITPPRNPCMGTAERVNQDLTVQTAACNFTVAPALSSDERETLGSDDGSWLERGIKVVSGDDSRVSFYVASAWFTAGAAHSSASFECRTSDRAGNVKSIADVFPASEARSIVDRARAFLTEQRELDPRASELPMPPADPAEVRDFVLPGGPGSGVLLCLTNDIEADAGHAQLLRVQ